MYVCVYTHRKAGRGLSHVCASSCIYITHTALQVWVEREAEEKEESQRGVRVYIAGKGTRAEGRKGKKNNLLYFGML